MAKIPATDISPSVVKNYIGEPYISIGNLCELGSLNPWSFYGPNDPEANPTTKVIQCKAGVSPFAIGDFRYYDHQADVGYVNPANSGIVNLYEGTHDGPADTILIEIQPEFKELNYKRLNASINAIACQVYDDAGYSSPVGIAHVKAITESTMSPAPPTGHQDQLFTKIIQPGSNNWNQISITNPWSYSNLYTETFLSDLGLGGDYGHTSDWQSVFTMNKIYLPGVSAGTKDETGDRGGYSWDDIFLGFTAKSQNDGDTSFNFTAQPYLYVPTGGPYTPTFYPIIGNFTFRYVYLSTEYDIQTLSNAGPDGLCNVTGALQVGDSLAYGEIRSINWKINTFSGLGAAMSTAPVNKLPNI